MLKCLHFFPAAGLLYDDR